MLRPAANLFALNDRDPGFLGQVENRLRSSGEFSEVWRPAPGWVVGQAMLPESAPDGELVRSRGLVFVEGRDRLEEGGGPTWLDRLEEIVERAPSRLVELPGDFTFLRFSADGDALAVRACAGIAPLYVTRRAGGGVAVGTLLNYFPRFLPERFRADPLINATLTACCQFIDGRTSVEGVSILPPASHTRLRPGGAHDTDIYWDPRPQEGEKLQRDPAHARELRSILIQSLERDLDPGGRNLLTLSGGVDSSALAALIVRQTGRGLSTFSMVPPAEDDKTRTLSYIDPLVSELGIESARKAELTIENLARWALEVPGLPFQVTHPNLCELPRIRSEQEVRVLVGGEFADELCGQWLRITDWARYTSIWQLVSHPRALPFGPRDYVRWTRRRVRDLIGRPVLPVPTRPRRWANSEVHAEYREWFEALRGKRARDRRPLKELEDHRNINAWLAMNWEATTSLGIRRSTPFYNREALELAFTCHPRELLGPGPKRLLREALHDDVPARNLFRADKGAWASQPETFDRDLADRVYGAVPPDEAGLAAVAAFARQDWLPKPPPGTDYVEACNLHLTMRIASYLAHGGR
jgi:asparagine synthetase B (glutamine-hydrolysing)